MITQPDPIHFELYTDGLILDPKEVAIEKASAEADSAFETLMTTLKCSKSNFVSAVQLFEVKFLLSKAGYSTSWPLSAIIAAHRQ